MDNNWANSRSQLDRVLELEHALARHQRQQWRQQQWQRLAGYGNRLQRWLTQPWRWPRGHTRLAPIREA